MRNLIFTYILLCPLIIWGQISPLRIPGKMLPQAAAGGGGGGTPTYEQSWDWLEDNPITTWTTNITIPSNTDQIMFVQTVSGASRAVTNVNIGGVGVNDFTIVTNGANVVGYTLAYLVNPPTGSQTLNVSHDGSARLGFTAHIWSGVNQSTPITSTHYHEGASANSGPATNTVSSASGEVVADFFWLSTPSSGASLAPDASQTEHYVDTGPGNYEMGHSSQSGAASVEMIWDWNGNRTENSIAISLDGN